MHRRAKKRSPRLVPAAALLILAVGCDAGASGDRALRSGDDAGPADRSINAVEPEFDSGDAGPADRVVLTIVPVRSGESGPVERVDVLGLPPAFLREMADVPPDADVWRERVPLRVVVDSADEQPAMLGEYRIDDATLKFIPRFPLVEGVTYRLSVGRMSSSQTDAESLAGEFSLPKANAEPSTVVTQIYPSGDTLPENQLKFYIHFSAPMSRGQAYERIQLWRMAGENETRDNPLLVEDPFLRLEEELWDRSGTRFTLLIDPGRIKRGLKPREELGPVLAEGGSYLLVISTDWEDAAGNPLKGEGLIFSKEFNVGPPDDVQPSVERWKIAPPAAGSVEPLVVTFDEPLDHAMLERVLRVRPASGDELSGNVSVENGETVWKFVADDPWESGEYSLVVDAALEDRAGNCLARPFEVDVFRKIERTVERQTVSRTFTVGSRE